MSMDEGSVVLTCLAFINNPREVLNTAHALLLDAVIIPSIPIAGSPPLTCSFVYIKLFRDEEVMPGVYEITAQVCVTCLCRFRQLNNDSSRRASTLSFVPATIQTCMDMFSSDAS